MLIFCVQEKTTKFSGEASALGKVKLGGSFDYVKKTTFDAVKKEGFSRMPSQGLNSFKPSCQDTNTVYITIVYFDIEGTQHCPAENLPHARSHKIIVTADGSVVDAKSLEGSSWLDWTGRNHKAEPCKTCTSLRSLCTVCLIESRMEKIQTSIQVVSECRLAETLVSVLEKMANDKVAKRQEEARQIMCEVEKLAKHYWSLEAKTKRSVRQIKVYGETLKEAAEDFQEDGIIADFWMEVYNMTEVKEALEKANEEHEYIRGQVKVIGERANWNAESFKEKADKAKKYLQTMDHNFMDCTFVSIPVAGQVLAVGGACMIGACAVEELEGTEYFDNLPCKIVAGTAAAVGGLVAGTVASIVTIPVGPYFWYKGISSHIDAKKCEGLMNQFGEIVIQMGSVEVHLNQITAALGEIEANLAKAIAAEERVVSFYEGEKRAKMIGRVVKRAEELINACDSYFAIVKRDAVAIEDQNNDSQTP